MFNKVTFALAVALLAGCADSRQLIRESGTPSVRLAPTDSVYIAVPEDGAYGADVYRGSGQNTARIVYSAFSKHTRSASLGRTAQSFDEARETAAQTGKKYLVYPMILHWEDRATEWSAIPDKVEIRLEISDVQTGTVISSAVVKGKSGLATLGGDHPQDLLPKPVEEFVKSLY